MKFILILFSLILYMAVRFYCFLSGIRAFLYAHNNGHGNTALSDSQCYANRFVLDLMVSSKLRTFRTMPPSSHFMNIKVYIDFWNKHVIVVVVNNLISSHVSRRYNKTAKNTCMRVWVCQQANIFKHCCLVRV